MPGDDLGNVLPATSMSTQQPPQRAPWEAQYMSLGRKRWVKRYRTELAASASSLCSTVLAYPLDSVKTRMQAYKFENVRDCFKHTYRTEGYNGFFRGVLSPLASITLVRTISFSIYQRTKYRVDDWFQKTAGTSPLEIANTRGAWPCFSTLACFGVAGATAGASITAIACPFELTKLYSQISVLLTDRSKGSAITPANGAYRPPGTFRTAYSLVKTRGFGGLYAGFHLHLLRDTIGTGVYFMSYESLKQILSNARGDLPTSPLPVAIAGGCCGLVSWAVIYPIDSAKSIYQRNYLRRPAGNDEAVKSPKVSFINKRMYRGLGVSMTRSAVVNSIFFSVFEFLKKRINRLDVDDPLPRKPRHQPT